MSRRAKTRLELSRAIFARFLLAFVLGFGAGAASLAQSDPPGGEPPFLDDFAIPEANPGDLVLPDEQMPVSDAQARELGNALVSRSEEVYRDVVRLETELKAHVERIIPELGRARAREIQQALLLPEGSGERKYRLGKLNAKVILALPDWDSEAGIRAIGEAIFLDRVGKGGNWAEDFKVSIPGVGFAEPKLVGGKLYPRIVDERTGSSHFFLENELEAETSEWRRYIARVRAWANRGRGRPQVFWVVHDPEVAPAPGGESVRIRYFPRPEGARQRLTNWWKAVYVRPDRQAFVQGGIKTILEVGSAELLTYLLSNGHVDHTFTMLTVGYASVLGVFGSTFRNALAPVDPTSFRERTSKMILRLLITSYSFGAWNRALQDGISSVSWFSPTGRAMNLEILQNSIASNMLRDGFNSLNDVREATGHARYSVDIAGVKLKGTQLERTLWYQVPNTLKNADLLTLGQPVNVLPHFLFYSAIVAAPVAVWRHAQAIRYENADDLPAARVIRFFDELGQTLGLLARDPVNFTPLIARVLGSYAQDAFLNCKAFLSRSNSSGEEPPATEAPFVSSAQGEWVEVRMREFPNNQHR